MLYTVYFFVSIYSNIYKIFYTYGANTLIIYYTYSRYIYKMIYINNDSNTLVIPTNRGKTIDTEFTLYLIGMSNVEYQFALVDSQTSSLYYSFPIEGWDIPVGQYNYELYQNEVLMASGLLQFGELKYEPEQKIFYNRQIIKIFYDRSKTNNKKPDETIS